MSQAKAGTAKGQDSIVISLVGMSNTGKSYISSKLAEELGFERVCVDDLIEQELESELVRYGYNGIEDMAKWMGQPYEANSAQNQLVYLDIETKIMKKLIKRIKIEPLTNNLVIDTTGSVVHTGHTVCSALSRVSTIVYFSVSDADMKEMFKNFQEMPKPIVWGGVFKLNHNYGSHDEAIAQYYPRLLRQRSELYSTMAHVTLPRKKLINIGAQEFLNKVTEGLSS